MPELTATTGYPVLFRTYSRPTSSTTIESLDEIFNRTLTGLKKVGQLTDEEVALIAEMQNRLITFPSGRYLWVGGTEWSEKPSNYYSLYNCCGQTPTSWFDFGTNFGFLMQGTGVGEVLEFDNVELLPPITRQIFVRIEKEVGYYPPEQREEYTTITVLSPKLVEVRVGDSREGWVQAYVGLLELASYSADLDDSIRVNFDLGWVRPKGEKIKGFGGVANPAGLAGMFVAMSRILNKAVGRQLTPIECSLLLNEAAKTTVAGNVRRSAKLQQFSSNDNEAAHAKDNLWVQDEEGNWKVDPEKDALRMSNFTRIFHTKPSLEMIQEAITKQYHSSEGAIMYAGEAVARANADLLHTPAKKKHFLELYDAPGTPGNARAEEFLGYLMQLQEEGIY